MYNLRSYIIELQDVEKGFRNLNICKNKFDIDSAAYERTLILLDGYKKRIKELKEKIKELKKTD